MPHYIFFSVPPLAVDENNIRREYGPFNILLVAATFVRDHSSIFTLVFSLLNIWVIFDVLAIKTAI